MSWLWRILPFVVITLSFLWGVKFYKVLPTAWLTDSASSQDGAPTTEITWHDIQTLDLETGEVSEEMRAALEAGPIRMPGFVVPLGSNFSNLTEVLLVPNQLACIHVPPPPPNLMIFVELSRPIDIDMASRAVWMEGRLSIDEAMSEYGKAAWTLKASLVEEYSWED